MTHPGKYSEELRKQKECILKSCEGTKQHRLIKLNKRVTVANITDTNFDDINERNEFGITALQLAAIENRAEAIESLLRMKGVLINRASGNNTDRNTALHFAAKFFNEEALTALLKNADINVRAKNKANKTALDLILENQFAKYSAIEMEKNRILLECRKDRENTELHEVILYTKNDINQLNKDMLKYVNRENMYGLTPFHLAAIRNFPDLVKHMMYNKELETERKSSCEYKLTAEQFAEKFGSLKVMDEFYRKVCLLNEAVIDNTNKLVLETRPMFPMRQNDTVLFGAGMNECDLREFDNRMKFLKTMCVENVSLCSQMETISLNPKDASMELCIFNNRIDLANILAEEGTKLYQEVLSETIKCPCVWSSDKIADIYFKAAMKSDQNTTIALHSMANTASCENSSLIAQLLDTFCHCTDTNTAEHNKHVSFFNTRLNILYREEPVFGETLMEKYILSDNIEIAKMILEKGASKPAIAFLFKVLEQPGESVAKFKYVYRLLAPTNIEKEKHRRTGLSLLHTAISCNKIQAVKFLLSWGFDVNKRSPGAVGGYTPLHQAVFQGNLEAVNLLIESNADDSLKADSYTPFEMALKKSNERSAYNEIIQKLFESNIEKNFESAADLLETVKRIKLFYDDYKHIIKRMLKVYFKSDKCRQSGKKHGKIFCCMLNKYFKTADYELVEYFLQAGIRPKRAALRHLIQHSVDEPQKIREIKHVYKLIVQYAANLCPKNPRKYISLLPTMKDVNSLLSNY